MKKWAAFIILMFSHVILAQVPPVVITNIAFNPTEPDAGEDVGFVLTLVNKDFDRSHTVTIKFLQDNKLTDVKVAVLEPRSAFSTSFTWKAEGGNHILGFSISYFTPEEFGEKREIHMSIRVPQVEDPLKEALTLYNERQFQNAKEKFVHAKSIFEAQNDAEGIGEAERYIALCDKYVSAEIMLLSAQASFDAGKTEDALLSFYSAKDLYVELGETETVRQIESRLAEIESKKTKPFAILDRQLLLYTGVVILAIVAVFIYVRSREGSQKKKARPEFLKTKLERAPREDKIVFFDEGEKGASFMTRCRKILESEIPDSQAYMRLAEEFRNLGEEFAVMKKEEAESVRKSYDICAQKIASEEKKWTSIHELENLLKRCDSFTSKYSNKAFLDKNMVEAYNLYTTMQSKFEELKGHDPELERRISESLRKCYYLIEDEIHKMRE